MESNALSIMTWNIDGLNQKYIEIRLNAALNTIISNTADIIALQEVVPHTASSIVQQLRAYGYVESNGLHSSYLAPSYFTMIFIKKDRIKLIYSVHTPYTGPAKTQMGRDINELLIEFSGKRVFLINTHLESCKESSKVRTAQLSEAVERLLMCDCPGFLCGDLNLRDDEVLIMKRHLQDKQVELRLLFDAWESAGSPLTSQSTWTMYNDSNIMKRVYRFDRIFCNGYNGTCVRTFRLDGLSVIPFPVATPASDHFAICASFSLESAAISGAPALSSSSSSVSTTTAVKTVSKKLGTLKRKNMTEIITIDDDDRS